MEMIKTPPPPLPLSLDHMNQTTSNSSTPYMSATSSPNNHSRTRPVHNFYYSAPTSPSSKLHNSFFDDVYDDFVDDQVALLRHNGYLDTSSLAAVPFEWEVKPGVAKKTCKKEEKNEEIMEDFEFDFSGQLDMMVRPSLSSADELFDGGKIRPLKLKPPPKSSSDCNNGSNSPKHLKSTMSKFKDALIMSPKHRKNVGFDYDYDPFEEAIRNARNNEGNDGVLNKERGRTRVKPSNMNMNMNTNTMRNNSRKGISRSLSPLRVSEFALLQHQDQQNPNEPGNPTGLFRRGSSNACSRNKWKLKDLFLFRSASEGHYKDTQSFSKRWSFRSSNMGSGSGSGFGSGSGSESGSVSKRRGQGSTHEMIYTKNRAVAEELKKKTMLPYRHGLLACLGFSPVLPQFSYAFPNTPPS